MKINNRKVYCPFFKFFGEIIEPSENRRKTLKVHRSHRDPGGRRTPEDVPTVIYREKQKRTTSVKGILFGNNSRPSLRPF